MNISAYILEYLKQFGTATVPGFGVFSLENSKAVINSENGSILPPASQIAFTPDYEVQSDDLAAFVSEQKEITPEASKSDLKIQTDFWKKKLQSENILEISGLGTLMIGEDSKIHFKGKRVESGHPDFYGLEEIKLSDIKTPQKQKTVESTGKEYKVSKSLLWIFLIAVPVAVIAYLAITNQELLFGNQSFTQEKDSIKKIQNKPVVIVKDTATLPTDSTMLKVSDSLKKDSVVKNSSQPAKVVSTVKAPITPKQQH